MNSKIAFNRLYARYLLIKFTYLLENQGLKVPFRKIKSLKDKKTRKSKVKVKIKYIESIVIKQRCKQLSLEKGRPKDIFLQKLISGVHSKTFNNSKRSQRQRLQLEYQIQLPEIFENSKRKMLNPLLKPCESTQEIIHTTNIKITKNYLNKQLIDNRGKKSKLVKQLQYLKMKKQIKPIEVETRVCKTQYVIDKDYLSIIEYQKNQKIKMTKQSGIKRNRVKQDRNNQLSLIRIWFALLVMISLSTLIWQYIAA